MRIYLMLFPLMFSLLVGCAGTGVNYSEAKYKLNTSSGNQVFILRKMGWVSRLVPFEVSVNSVNIGAVGEKQTLVGNLRQGKNTLRLYVGGLFSIGVIPDTVEIYHSKGEDRFFTVGVTNNIGVIKSTQTLKLIKVSEATWKATARE